MLHPEGHFLSKRHVALRISAVLEQSRASPTDVLHDERLTASSLGHQTGKGVPRIFDCLHFPSSVRCRRAALSCDRRR